MSLLDFIADDSPRTLFPLEAPTIIIGRGQQQLMKYIDDEVFATTDYHPTFVQAPIAFALKNRWHTRRVHVLDPVATLYLYNFVRTFSSLFQAPAKNALKRRFGYHLKSRSVISAADEHQEFRRRILEFKKTYAYFAKLDIANCFASFYHHDLVSALKPSVGEQAANRFGTFLRQLNGGRSISCFPQGYFPTKAIGNLFLGFIEQSVELQSPAVIRYVDDVFIFSNSRSQLEADVFRLQVILSEKNLYLNAAKTDIGDTKSSMQLPKTDEIRKSLLQKRETAVAGAYDDEPEPVHLLEDEFRYLSSLISGTDVSEEDVELALALIIDEEHAERLARLVFERYPHLIKNLYAHLSNAVYEGDTLWDLVGSVAADREAHEFSLFWCVRIVLRLYDWDKQSAVMLARLYDHPKATDTVRAAVLECRFNSFGLVERKEAALRNAGANLLAISAAAGLRELEPGRRNQLYKYAASSSPMMYQVTSALQRAPGARE